MSKTALTKRQNDGDEDPNAPLRKGRGRQPSTNPETSVVEVIGRHGKGSP